MKFDLNSYVSRWIAFGGAALAAIVATFIANEAQILFNLNLDQGTLVGYLAPFLIGTFGLAWKWLEGRADQELTVLEHQVGGTLHLSPEVIAAIEATVEKHLPTPPTTTDAPVKRGGAKGKQAR